MFEVVSTFFLIIGFHRYHSAFGAPHDGFGPGKQDWGFVEVRPGAFTFWWLFYTARPDVDHYSERPLLIWLQGGPGGSSTGYGNFAEIGPLDVDLHPRQHSWVNTTSSAVNNYNVLFIDNPVGSGFSYVDNVSLLAKDNAEIAADLMQFVKEFYRMNPQFGRTPLHVFSESYGGKMAVEFALLLDEAIKEGELSCNLRSVALGSPWISPEDSVLSWGEFLLNLGFVDTKGYEVIQNTALDIQALIRAKRHAKATDFWRSLEHVVLNETFGIDCYNVLLPQQFRKVLMKEDHDDDEKFSDSFHYQPHPLAIKLEHLMRGPVSNTLHIPPTVVWGSQKAQVFKALSEDFMKPANKTVELLLNNTNLEVIVYTGQLDLVVCTPGTVRWVENLRWPGASEYMATPRLGMGSLGILEGYEKSFDRLSMYWINRAGHMAPADNPMAMQYILDKHVGT